MRNKTIVIPQKTQIEKYGKSPNLSFGIRVIGLRHGMDSMSKNDDPT